MCQHRIRVYYTPRTTNIPEHELQPLHKLFPATKKHTLKRILSIFIRHYEFNSQSTAENACFYNPLPVCSTRRVHRTCSLYFFSLLSIHSMEYWKFGREESGKPHRRMKINCQYLFFALRIIERILTRRVTQLIRLISCSSEVVLESIYEWKFIGACRILTMRESPFARIVGSTCVIFFWFAVWVNYSHTSGCP